MLRYIHTILVSFLFFSAGSLAYGQDAQIQGQVLDPSGAAIPKAIVRVVDQRTGTEARAETNENGEYTVPALNPGIVYKVFVQAAGFSTAASDPITFTAAQNALLNFTLRVGGVSANVDVTAIVTAEKREERLLDVPVPVSIINTSALGESSQVLVKDFAATVPNFSAAPSLNGIQM